MFCLDDASPERPLYSYDFGDDNICNDWGQNASQFHKDYYGRACTDCNGRCIEADRVAVSTDQTWLCFGEKQFDVVDTGGGSM